MQYNTVLMKAKDYPRTFRFKKETVDQLEELEKRYGLNKTEIMRRLIELAYNSDSEELEIGEPWIKGQDATTLRELANQLKETAFKIESAT